MEKKDKSIFYCIKSIIKYYKGTGLFLFLYFLNALLEAGIGVISPLISARLINNITGGIVDQIVITAALILALEIFSYATTYFKSLLYRTINKKSIVAIQNNITEEILKIKTKEIDKNSTGLFVDRLSKDAGDLSGVLIEISYWSTSLLGRLGILISIFILNKYVFFYSVITSFISFFLTKYREEFLYKNNKVLKKLNEEKTSIIAETVRGLRDVKVLNASESLLDKIMEKVKIITDKFNDINTRYMLIGQICNTIHSIFSFGYIVLLVYLYTQGQIIIASFITLYYFRTKSRAILDGISKLFSYLKNFQLSFNRVNEIMGDTFEKEEFGNIKVDKLEGNIEFKNVKFGYDDKNILKGMSFKIKANERVAFVGKSGAGKTTLFSLVTKLYEINSGEILLDGYNINDLTKESIRDNISLITQNPYIFNFTVYENFTAVKKDVTLKEVRRVCKLARIDDYIMSLPDKYDTKLGEGGVILSGGQKQRLAIARALLLKTEIILFDEATSALDNETQTEITEAINSMQGEYTILIVAHRLSTIVDCDKIFVIDDGKIIAEGNHKQLMKKCDFYRDLYQQEL